MQKIQFQVISVKSVEYTDLNGHPAVSNRCFVCLTDGSIGYLKTPKPVKAGSTIECDVRMSKDGALYLAITEVLPQK